MISSAALGDDLPLDRLLATEISTVSKYAQTVTQAPASVTIISSEEIRRYGWQSLADVIQTVRGFYTSYDRNYHYVGARGFGRPTDYNNRLLLLLDGHALNENVFGAAPFGTDLALDLDSLERIEIVRGPGSAVYGTGAMLAVVNLITRRGSSIDGAGTAFTGGNHGRIAGSILAGTETANGFDIAISAVVNRTEGADLSFPEFGGATARGLDFDDYEGFLATLRFGGFSVLANAVSRRKGMPTASFGVDFGHPESHTRDERALGEVRFERALATQDLVVLRGFVDRSHYEGIYPYDGEPWLDRADGRWAGVEGRYRKDLRAHHRLTAGVEYISHRQSSYDFATRDRSESVSFSEPYRVTSAYVEDEYQPRGNVSVIAGIRLDDYANIDRAAFSPRAALVWEARSGLTAKLLYGRAYRAPSTYELAYVDPFGGVQGNPDLEIESIDTLEAVVEYRLSDALWGAANVYHYRMRDLIDAREADGVIRLENTGTVRARGVEAELHGRFDDLWTFANVAWQVAEEPRGHLTNSPRFIARAGASSSLGERLDGGAELLYESSRHTLHGGRTRAAFVANSRLGITLTPRIELSAIVRNLFDADYATPAGFEHRQDAIAQDGRTLILTLRLER